MCTVKYYIVRGSILTGEGVALRFLALPFEIDTILASKQRSIKVRLLSAFTEGLGLALDGGDGEIVSP